MKKLSFLKNSKLLYITLIIVSIFSLFISDKINNQKEFKIEQLPLITQDSTSTPESNLTKMTEKEKQGELVMSSIPDKVLSNTTIDFLKRNHINAVILMGNNIENDEQLINLTKDLRSKVNSNMLIAIDQEGGTVSRISWEPHSKISQKQIGDMNDLDYAYKIAFERGQFLKERGINVILGPVADIAYTPNSFMIDRAFGSDPKKVSDFVRQSVRGYKNAGVVPVLKHFPGHGNTNVDSHESFPTINVGLEELTNTDLLPFKAGLEEGAEIIMLGHIINPQIDTDLPASISEKFLKYSETIFDKDFVLMTDDLKMSGQIEGGSGWAINIIIESESAIENRISKIVPRDKYVEKIIILKSKIE